MPRNTVIFCHKQLLDLLESRILHHKACSAYPLESVTKARTWFSCSFSKLGENEHDDLEMTKKCRLVVDSRAAEFCRSGLDAS